MVFTELTPQSVFIALFSFALVPLLTLLTRTALLAPQALSWYISGASDLFSTGGKDRVGGVCRRVGSICQYYLN